MTTSTHEQETPHTAPRDAAPLTATKSPKSRIVVLGGGVAGLTAAHELRRHLGISAEITLISDSDRFLLGLALPWVPFGRTTGSIGFSIASGLRRQGITFVHAFVEHVSTQRKIVLARNEEIPYDYLLIATGPRADSTAIPGVSGEFNTTTSIWTERGAVEAGHALERLLNEPGPVVVGAAQGAAYISAAYEFALLLDDALRRKGVRDRVPLTFVTPEPFLGHLDIGAPAARRVMERFFAQRGITTIVDACISAIDRAGVHLSDGRTLPATYTMILPPVAGISSIQQSPELTDEQGFIPVDSAYRHLRWPDIYACGVAAHISTTSPAAEGVPKTGYLAAAMARAAARNIVADIKGQPLAARGLPRLLDLRIIDGGDGGVLVLTAERLHPRHLALALPGRMAHWTKQALTRYLLWKLRTGHTNWP